MSKLILRGGLVWDGMAATASEGVVVTDGQHITASDGASGRTLDVSRCTVMPGLIEGHAHLCFDATPGWKSTYDSDSRARMLLRMVANSGKRSEERRVGKECRCMWSTKY